MEASTGSFSDRPPPPILSFCPPPPCPIRLSSLPPLGLRSSSSVARAISRSGNLRGKKTVREVQKSLQKGAGDGESSHFHFVL